MGAKRSNTSVKNSHKGKRRKHSNNKGKSKKRYIEKVYIVKKPFYRRWWFWVICLIFITTVIGILSDNETTNNNKATAIATQSSKNSDIKNNEAPQRIISFGEEGDSEGLSLKIVDKEERDSIEAMGGYSRYTPEDGGKYALVNITLKNNGNESKGTNNGYFKLVKDEKTYTPSTLIVTGTDERFFTFESLNPGLSASGFIVFEVPKEFTFDGAQIRFDGTGIFNDPIIFNLN